ncbi:MAG: hypothetical protein M0P04_05925 [Syntrophales bacterium]|jgi:hypothetical protein|nr:hypothetical protein [Syntrophales bacterium]MDD4340442.1 hypothetical protein [Syntrophales bacterium]HOG08260.1 hypothetical protein [Syntrophales bacterium]HOS77458.1 hypothetical protein [Syntrophales bacterium]HPB69515.1 hypothetical protein [Syntrophales bacterium]
MTEKDKGHFADKHRGERSVSPALAAAIRDKAGEGKLPCRRAETICREMDVTMGEVGKAADLMELEITKCQLGLFGFAPDRKAVKPAAGVSPEFETDIRAACVDGRLPCRSAWDIAARRRIPKMDVSAACEALEIKVKPCQLGAF